MLVLVNCEESQTVTKAFRRLGHEAYSCDKIPCSGGRPDWHLQMDGLVAMHYKPWDIMIGHPPCTYNTVTGNKWFNIHTPRKSGVLVGTERHAAREESILFFKQMYNAPIKKIALENPVGVISTRFMKPTQIVHPWQFGHEASKKTCLWLKGLPPLVPTNIVGVGEFENYKSGKRTPKWYADAADLPPAERTRVRNRTFEGIADAMAQQWGGPVFNISAKLY